MPTAGVAPKRWSLAVGSVCGSGFHGRAHGNNSTHQRNMDNRRRTSSRARNSEEGNQRSEYDDGSLPEVVYFNPNDRRYRCCCGQSHSTMGVRVIAGFLCVTIVLELWHIGWYWISAGIWDREMAVTSTVQLLFGIGIASTVIVALWRESAVFLLPYLLLQAVGLAAVFVILLALIYICVDSDLDTVKAFVEAHSPTKLDKIEEEDQRYLVYMGWTMVVSCAGLLALQLWLISIVFACWRYFREKRNFGYSEGITSSLVVLRSFRSEKNEQNEDNQMEKSREQRTMST